MSFARKNPCARRMDRADQSVTRHAAASRAAYETLYAAFASQPAGIKESHRGVLDSLRAELRLDLGFARKVEEKYGKRGKGGTGQGASAEENTGYSASEGPAIQIAWKEASACLPVPVG